MPISPEVHRFIKRERIDPYDFAIANQERRQNRKSLRKEKRREKLFEGIYLSSERAVQGFFKGVSTIRTHKPDAISLFPWEKHYLENYTADIKKADPPKKETWKALREQGVDARHMYIVYLQDKMVVPQSMLHELAGQATTEANRKSWLDFNTEVQSLIGHWVDRQYPTLIADGMTKGLLSVVPQHPDEALEILGAGAVSSQFHARSWARRSNLLNHLSRLPGEFSTLLQVHYQTHERSLAQFRGLPIGEIDQVSERIFTGSRLAFESKMIKDEAKAIATGVGVAQTVSALGSDSPSTLGLRLLGPALAAGYLYRVMRKERSGEAVGSYIQAQTDLLTTAKDIKRTLASQRGATISVDLYQDTELPKKRHTLVEATEKNWIKVKRPLDTIPWWLAIASTLPDVTSHMPSPAGSLITGGIIVSALGQYEQEFTRQRTDEVRRKELEHISAMINAINLSSHSIPNDIERREMLETLQLPEISERDSALQQMKGFPLVINKLDNGAYPRSTVSIEGSLTLQPGISFVQAPSGTGKSELLRMIALEQGLLKGLDIKKGIDLRQINAQVLPDIVHLVEVTTPSSEKTIAEQLASFLTESGENAFKKALLGLQKDRSIVSEMGDVRLNNHLNRIVNPNDRQFAQLLELWVEDPNIMNARVSGVVNKLLNSAAMKVLQNIFPNIDTREKTAEFLSRKPGSTKGTSTGEAQRWEICKALLKERAVLLLDEPTSNLESGDNSSFEAITNALSHYMDEYPDTVILAATNDDRLPARFVLSASSYPWKNQIRTRLENFGTTDDVKWVAQDYLL